MPRLRKLKNFNFVASQFEEKEDASQDASHLEDLQSEENERCEACEASGESWLSNNRIISSLAEDEILQAIKYHELQAKILKEELSARSAGLRSRILFPGPSDLSLADFVVKEHYPHKKTRELRSRCKASKLNVRSNNKRIRRIQRIVKALLALQSCEVKELLEQSSKKKAEK